MRKKKTAPKITGNVAYYAYFLDLIFYVLLNQKNSRRFIFLHSDGQRRRYMNIHKHTHLHRYIICMCVFKYLYVYAHINVLYKLSWLFIWLFQGQKSLALDTAIGMWQLLFEEKEWPLVDHWCQFLQVIIIKKKKKIIYLLI